jgi:hypothetical protein
MLLNKVFKKALILLYYKMPSIKVGFFEDDITGPVGFPQTGYRERRRVSQGIIDRLYCRTLYIKFKSEKYALVSLDLCGVDKKFREKTCSRIETMTGIPKENIIIAATHTHSGVDGFLLGWNFKIKKFPNIQFYKSKDVVEKGDTKIIREFVSQKVAGSVYAATRSIHEASVVLNWSEVLGIGSNREDPRKPYDSELITLKFKEKKGKNLGCIINYPCHPTVLGYNNYFYSADFIGYACQFVKSYFGQKFVPVYFNGACAEISTRFTRKGQTVREAKRLGYLLGRNILSLLTKNGVDYRITDINLIYDVVELPAKKLPTLNEAQKAVEGAKKEYLELKNRNASPAELRIALTKLDGALDILERIKIGDFKDKIVIPLQALRLDDIVIIGVPGELHSSIALNVKSYGRQLGKKIIIVGYANDYMGYILPPEEYRNVNYETIISQIDEEGASLFIYQLKSIVDKI